MAKKTGRSLPHRVRLKMRRLKALKMRSDGATFEEIAQALGYASRNSAYQSLVWELRQEHLRAAEGLRNEEAARLDALVKKLWPLVAADPPDLRAVHELVHISRRRAELFGLDQPTQRRPSEKPPKPRVIHIEVEEGEPARMLPQH